MEKLLKIGELAGQTGVTAKTIRFYEEAGVLAPSTRAANGYRLYSRQAVAMLRFIKQARGLDLTLAQITELVAIRQRGEVPCSHVYRLLEEKAVELRRKLQDVTALRRELRRSVRTSGRTAATYAVCPHIEARAAMSQRTPSPGR